MTSACLALFTSALLAGAATSCGQIFGLPDGTLDDGGDGSPDAAPRSEGGADGQADTGTSSGDAGPRNDADGSTPSSDGGTSDGGTSGDATSADAAPDAGEGGGTSDCAPAALLFYEEDEFNNLFVADFPDKKYKNVTTIECIDPGNPGEPQHLAMTRAGHAWLLGENARIYDVSLKDGTCSGLGTVTGGENFDDMSLAFARLGGASTDGLYTCSPDGLGQIDPQSFAWTSIDTPSEIDHALGCTVKQGRNGNLAVLASTGTEGDPAYTLYEVEVDGTKGKVITKKAFDTAIYDNGDDNNTFDLAWSNSLYYIYANTMDNEVDTYTYDPVSGDVSDPFDFGGQFFVTAAQSTCAQ